jgi:two-component system, NtrC family, response regulator PilR
MSEEGTVLLVEDDVSMRESLVAGLEFEGYRVISAGSPKEAEPLLLHEIVDLVITDLKMPDGGGLRMVELVREAAPETPVIMITAFPSVESAVSALKSGVVDYLIKPFTPDQLAAAAKGALCAGQARDRAMLMRGMGPVDVDVPEIVGSSEALRELLHQVRRVAAFNAHVLILGETGTGKELVARALHRLSPRSGRPFVAINCAAIPDTLFESELFGHVKGAFTGAVTAKKGLLEQADGGTLFLDEIGDLSPTSQAKLLRTLESGTCRKVGGTAERPVDVRVVSAANRDLQEEVRAGLFREDIFYRLAALEVRLPPLRERSDDVPQLASFFLDQLAEGSEVGGFSEEAIGLLESYEWPGNVRELQNAVQRLLARASGKFITGEDVIRSGVVGHKQKLKQSLPSPRNRREAVMSGLERRHLARVLEEHDGNVTHAARALGVHRTTLQRLMVKHGLRSNRRS